jgi:TPR repeat protein
MVKDMDVPGLTLTLGQDARGDYPVEVYQLDADSGPQARQRLILRIDNAPQVYAAGFGLSWPAAAPKVPQDPDAAVEADVSREQAQRLLGAGDIAAARRLLTDLAEQGHADAAYELALTYDREVLAKAGLADVDSDAAIARAWYEYAARADHAGATQRLEALAKRRAGA